MDHTDLALLQRVNPVNLMFTCLLLKQVGVICIIFYTSLPYFSPQDFAQFSGINKLLYSDWFRQLQWTLPHKLRG